MRRTRSPQARIQNIVHVPTSTATPDRPVFGRPQIVFFCELSGAALQALLHNGTTLDELAEQGYGIALATRNLDTATAEVVRALNQRQIPTIAWLLLPQGEGSWFHLQNYPQAIERYRSFQHWVRDHALQFQAIGIDIEPPSSELDRIQRWGLRELARRLWLARENVLYAAARSAYTDLIARIHHDGYEVHTYQLPILADDRRAGTTLAQRALDIVDLPADVEVLMCYSSAPLEALASDLGGALITSYGPAADGIGIGALAGSTVHDGYGEGLPPLPWDALERDLLLAAHYTDMIYVYSLEGCAEQGLLPRIAAIEWAADVRPTGWKRALVGMLRGLLLLGLLLARFSRGLVAWLGWALFALMLARRLRFAVGHHRPDRRAAADANTSTGERADTHST